MPRNLVTAQSVVKIRYAQPAVGQFHTQVMFFDCQVIQQDAPYNLALFGIVNPATSEDWLVHDVIREVWNRHADNLSGVVPPVAIGLVEAWHNVPDSEDEVFVGFDTHVYTDIVGGIATPYAGSTITYNMQTAERYNTRLVFCDQSNLIPVKIPGVNPPALDDGSLAWFLLNSNVPFSNNDGVPLARHVSVSYDWNDKLLRTYGLAWNLAALS